MRRPPDCNCHCVTPCSIRAYPFARLWYGRPTFDPLVQDEAELYYGLTTPKGEYFYNYYTEVDQLKIWDDPSILTFDYVQNVCQYQYSIPLFGYGKFLEFLDAGGTIFLFAEVGGCILSYIVDGWLEGLECPIEFLAGINFSGFQSVVNRAPKNNLNYNIDLFPVGGSSASQNGIPIVKNGPTIVEAYVRPGGNNGKVILFGDANMKTYSNSNSELQKLVNNVCSAYGDTIYPTDSDGNAL